MLIVFIHGWSVTNTDTYGGLPQAILANSPSSLNLKTAHLFLSKYVCFSDEISIDDIARAMQHALKTEVIPKLAADEPFVCFTHTTGAPVVRAWISLYYGNKLVDCPISHLTMLAPANHDSVLAQLDRSRLSRLRFLPRASSRA